MSQFNRGHGYCQDPLAGFPPVLGQRPFIVLDTIADLEAFRIPTTTDTEGYLVQVMGYYAANDGGGGFFTFAGDSDEEVDGGTVFESSVITDGKWFRFYAGELNAKWFGAIPDLGDDVTLRLQAAIDGAAALAAELYIPDGEYKFSRLTIQEQVLIRGGGWRINVLDGDYSPTKWLTAQGTVLRSSVTSGVAIAIGKTADFGTPFNLRDLLVCGPGIGTSTGIRLGERTVSGTQRSDWHNVCIGNFSTGAEMNYVERCTFTSLHIQGCKVGLLVSDADFASNLFLGSTFGSCLEKGVWCNAVTAGNTRFIGGQCSDMLQNGFLLNRAENWVIDNMWFENNDLTGGYDILLQNTIGCRVINCQDFKNQVVVSGEICDHNMIAGNIFVMSTDNVLVTASVINPTIVRDNFGVDLQDDSGLVEPYTEP